ncbi:MAG: glycosyltransferase [Pseudomonadota bacterium]
MKITVIMAAYNKPSHLDRALNGYAVQDDDNFEVIVTEDGQAESNKEVINHLRTNTSLKLRHLTQEDTGFRKTVALNRAIEAADGEYLIFTDDDCIPRKDVVSKHRKYAREGRFIVGAYNRLPLSVSERITAQDVQSQRAFRLSWLMRNGFFPTRGFFRIIVPSWLAVIMDMRGPLDRGRFPGGHASCFKKDAQKIGGFNERMAYGLEDREFGLRLCNSGLVGKRVKNSTYMLHLDHDRPYRHMEEFAENKKILDETIASGRIVSSHLDKSKPHEEN